MLNIKIKFKDDFKMLEWGIYGLGTSFRMVLSSINKDMVLEDIISFKDYKIKDVFQINMNINNTSIHDKFLNEYTIKDIIESKFLIKFIEKTIKSIEVSEHFMLDDNDIENEDIVYFMKKILSEEVNIRSFSKDELVKLLKEYKYGKN